MDKARIIYLHQQYLNKAITTEEWAEFKLALDNSGSNRLLAEFLDPYWSKISEAEILALRDPRFEKIYNDIVKRQQPISRIINPWYKISAAVAILFVFAFGLYFSTNFYKHKNSDNILPGKSAATLILSDGKKIKLTDSLSGELAKEAGVSITANDNGQLIYKVRDKEDLRGTINTLYTDKSETYKLVLPDGSKIWLNAASSLTYSTSFNGQNLRKVSLEGEAYFEVSKDKSHPFIVETKTQKVEVLGTHFNINAYTDEPVVKTTLIEGSVKVSNILMKTSGREVEEVLLKPNQEAVMDSQKIRVRDADTEAAIAWTNGKFIFRNEDLPSIMRRIASWYGIEVNYKGNVSDVTYWGAVSRTTNLTTVLDYFSKTGNVEFVVEGKRVTVIKK